MSLESTRGRGVVDHPFELHAHDPHVLGLNTDKLQLLDFPACTVGKIILLAIIIVRKINSYFSDEISEQFSLYVQLHVYSHVNLACVHKK